MVEIGTHALFERSAVLVHQRAASLFHQSVLRLDLGECRERDPSRINWCVGHAPKAEARFCFRLQSRVFGLKRSFLVSQRCQQIRTLRLTPELAIQHLRRPHRQAARRAMVTMAVPTRMPSRFISVEKAEGSGLPSGVTLPVSRLSPFRLSTQMASNSSSNRWRMTT